MVQPYQNSASTQQRWYDGNGGVGTVQSRPGHTEISYQNGGSPYARQMKSGNPYGVQSNTNNPGYGKRRAGINRLNGNSGRRFARAANTPNVAGEAYPRPATTRGAANETYPQMSFEEQRSTNNLLAKYRRSHFNSPGGKIRNLSQTSGVFGTTWW